MRGLIEKINNLSRKQSTLLIGIDGLGGSGKSTVAKLIKEGIANTAIVEMDDFYVPKLKRADWDRVYEQVIRPLKNNSAVSYQRFDWNSNKLAEWRAIEPGGVVVIEGVYSLHENIRGDYDYKIWVECPYEARLRRGLKRDGEGARSKWVNEWMPKEEEYRKSQQPFKTADIIIDGQGLKS